MRITKTIGFTRAIDIFSGKSKILHIEYNNNLM